MSTRDLHPPRAHGGHPWNHATDLSGRPERAPVDSPRSPVHNDVATPLARAIASTISRRLAKAAEEDVRARYELGRSLRAIREGQSAAEQILRTVADALDVHPSLVRRYVRVATVISPAQLEGFVVLRNRNGMPMTWSHLEHLAEVGSARQRATLAAQIIAEKLSVRALKERVRRAPGGENLEETALGPASSVPATSARLLPLDEAKSGEGRHASGG